MKVTNVDDHVTHAILGSGSVESFGMSENAGLFHILHNAMYSRKKEAAVREILCNGWDAHIEFGVKRPMEITLTNEIFELRDFGPGIPHHLIKPIYGTYGESTKLKNTLATGGFGLGTKAPFSYADHFEVISRHDGIKNIYRMSKSNAEVAGKPSINHILDVPTDEHGLSVKFDIKSRDDRDEFEQLIRNIVSMGGMNVLFNGNKLPCFPFDEMEEDFMFIKDQGNKVANDGEKLRVRYGHVSYPVPDHVDFQRPKDWLKKFARDEMNNSSAYGYSDTSWTLVVQAPADGLTVTPSRESISLTDATVETLKELLEGVMAKIKARFEPTIERMYYELLDCIPQMERPSMLYSEPPRVPLQGMVRQSMATSETKTLTSFDQMGQFFLAYNYPDFIEQGIQGEIARLRVLTQVNPKMLPLLKSWEKYIRHRRNHPQRMSYLYDLSNLNRNWYIKNVFWRALKGGEKYGIKSRNFILRAKSRKAGRSNRSNFGLSMFNEACFNDMQDHLRGYIVIAHNTTDEHISRMSKLPIVKWLGRPNSFLIYKVPRNKATIAKAVKHFNERGFHVIDLTKILPGESEEDVAPVIRKAPVKKTPKGLPKLSYGLLPPKKRTFSTGDIFEDEDLPRLTKPELIVQISKNAEPRNTFDDYSSQASAIIARRWGDKIGVVQNSRQADTYIKKGAVNLNAWLYKTLLDEYTNNPLIKEHYENSVDHLPYDQGGGSKSDIVTVVRHDPELQKHFGLSDPATQDTLDIVQLFGSFPSFRHRYDKELKEIQGLIDTWKLNKPLSKLVRKLSDNPVLECLDAHHCKEIILDMDGKQKPSDIKAVRNILRNAIER